MGKKERNRRRRRTYSGGSGDGGESAFQAEVAIEAEVPSEILEIEAEMAMTVRSGD